ncbi:hypothetical protein Droror1_Dr00011161 [Drosera rotundifolia]
MITWILAIPWLYDASKRFLRNFQICCSLFFPLSFELLCHWCLNAFDFFLKFFSPYHSSFFSPDLPEVDDHCHVKTLKPLSVKCPNVRVISTPNAKDLLDPLFIKFVQVFLLAFYHGVELAEFVC